MPATLLLAAAVLLTTGCGVSDDMMATIGMPTSETTPAGANAQANPQPPALGPPVGSQPGNLVVTSQQRGYLDALTAAGIHPSSELLALSIGSYVCQARAAKQTDQEVRAFVLPLVRNDVDSVHPSSMPPSAAEIDAATADYIRIATERLC